MPGKIFILLIINDLGVYFNCLTKSYRSVFFRQDFVNCLTSINKNVAKKILNSYNVNNHRIL